MPDKLPARLDEPVRTGLKAATLKQALLDNLFYVLGRFPCVSTQHDQYRALAYTVRDRLLERWTHSGRTYLEQGSRTVCYLSAEYLLGPHLGNNILNLGIEDAVREAVTELGVDLDDLLEQEEEPGLGNGGLGRLAACYLDSMATLQIPCIGYGIRYEFGIFDQQIKDGWQVERTDKWLHAGNPWDIKQPSVSFPVMFGGRTERYRDAEGRERTRWLPERMVKGVAYETPILGYRVNNASLLRLWSAEAVESFDFQAFNVGDYYSAVEEKVLSENLSKVLYPNDEALEGKQLRLEQQFFFVSCSLQDMIRLLRRAGKTLEQMPDFFVAQLNDTHPAVAVAELMRLLVDEHAIGWDDAWAITRKTLAYTNHTLLPEALEKWTVALFGSVLPRHLEIVYEINRRFLDDEVRTRYPDEEDRVRRLSIIDETGPRYVRMAHLATVGAHHVNGVAALHTELLKTGLMADFYDLWPDKFSNVTNGVTPRRFLALGNPALRELLDRTVGGEWLTDLSRLRALEEHVDDREFAATWRRVKHENKIRLAKRIERKIGVVVDPHSMFDVLVKRIHEYKRQHLLLLHVITLYNRIKQDPAGDVTPRTVILGGKAAPGYFLAKLIVKLFNDVAAVVNEDADVAGRLRLVFVPDYSVKMSQFVFPAADLSEQISMAGKEASGTGNMKFAMNGALTIGTLDGANLEIREEVGAENFFLFGLTAEEVRDRKAAGHRPMRHYEENVELKAAIDKIADGYFSPDAPERFQPLIESLLQHDPYLVLADYADYVAVQDTAARTYRDEDRWTRMSILNVARIGKFSSDRAIRDYCAERIWNVGPVHVELDRKFQTKLGTAES